MLLKEEKLLQAKENGAKVLLLQKEITPEGIIVSVQGEEKGTISNETLTRLSLRNRVNKDLDYYLMIISKEIQKDIKGYVTVEHFIAAVQEEPGLLDKSEMIVKL